MPVVNYPIEKVNKGFAYIAESISDYFELINSKEKHDFELTGSLFFDKSKGNVKILNIKADFIHPDYLPGIYNIFLYEKGKLLGTIKYNLDHEKIENKIEGIHYLNSNKLLLLINEFDSNHTLESTYCV